MRIAVVSNVCGCQWAGSEEVWYRMALLALEKGHEVVACLHPDLHAASTLEEFRKRGGEVLGWRRSGVARLQNWGQRIRPNFSDAKLGDPDLILLSCGSLPAITYVPGLMGYLKNTSAKLAVLCLFNAEALAFSATERSAVAELLEKSRANIFVADQNRRQAVRQFGVDLRDAHVFYGPLRERFDVALPMPPLESGVVFSCVARLDLLWKAQDILLEVLAGEKWLRRDWKLRIYGTGADREHIQKLVQIFDLSARVEFRGYAKDMRDIWRDSHVMVLPSRGEGTPLATLEAMMCGRPVLTTDVGGNREVLEEGVTGWIAEGATPNSFALAMERCWEAQGSWAQMGAQAHAKALGVAGAEPSKRLLEVLELAAKPHNGNWRKPI
jgi:glycosyltransferase involved in cell wall biosynthesis